MRDINATMFFKAKFTICSTSPEPQDLLWKLILEVRNWITGKLNRKSIVIDPSIEKWSAFKYGGRFFDETNENRVYAESAYYVSQDCPDKISWACRISESQRQNEGYAPREWVTEIGYQSNMSGEAEISYVVSFTDFAGFIGFCSPVPDLNVPNVIKNLLQAPDISCYIGKTCITLQPIPLKKGDFEAFKELLMSPERKVPILYIAPKGIGDKVSVSPSDLAESVAGNAVVYYATDVSFSDEMNALWDERYVCANGAIRLYKPGIDLDSPRDSYKHRYLTASFIDEHGSKKILDIFRRALAQDVHYYEDLFRLDKCRALGDADKRNERILRMIENKDDELNEIMKDALEEIEKRESAERDAKTYREENDRLKEEIYGLNVQVQSMRGQVGRCSELEQALNEIRSFKEQPNDATSIARFFAKVFADRIAFTERAIKSLADCSTRADVLWEALYYMATELHDCLKNDPSQAYKTFHENTGWECSRGEGKMTRADSGLMRQYEDIYEGHTINIEAHVKNGVRENDAKFVRIYFSYDSTVDDKIIIGHCGKHLDNYSTRRAK